MVTLLSPHLKTEIMIPEWPQDKRKMKHRTQDKRVEGGVEEERERERDRNKESELNGLEQRHCMHVAQLQTPTLPGFLNTTRSYPRAQRLGTAP